MRAKIIRIDKSLKGVFGVLTLNDETVCVTLERPWADNKPNISCVPEDIYLCERVDSPRYGDTFKVMDVPGRTNILFHKGNVVDDSLGCVLLGSEYGALKDQRAVLNSSKAFFTFMKRLEGLNHFPLQIINI